MNITLTQKTTGGMIETNAQKACPGDGYGYVEPTTVPAGSVDKPFIAAIDVSQISLVVMLATKDMTVETNSGTVPGNTIHLKANLALVWTPDSYFVNPLTVDVTGLFVTNSGQEEGTFSMECLYDATP